MKKRIAIVDDNLASLTITKMMLSKDFEVIPLTSGEKLLQMLEKIVPDLIIMDIEMPQMSGFECLEEIINRNYNVPVMFLSGNTGENVERAKELGAARYITKPMDQASLVKIIDKFFQK